MTKYTRLTGKVFGSSATATGNNPEIGQFGSALAGTYNGTTDVSTIQSLPAWQKGFIGCVTPNTQFPPLPEMTGFGKVLSQQICYLLQQGVAEWDSGTTYYENNWCAYQGKLYISKSDENLNHLPTNTTYWSQFTGGSSRNLGEYVTSSLPLTDTTLHLADGSLLNSSDYPELVSHIGSIYASSITANFGVPEQDANLSSIEAGSVTYGNNIFLARTIGSNNSFSTSTDGITWNTPYQVSVTNFDKTNNGLAYGNNIFVAIGNLGQVSTSSDGVNWSSVQTKISTSNINTLFFDGEKFIAVDWVAYKLWTSSDANTWVQVDTTTPAGFEILAYNNNIYVAATSAGYIFTSPDLENWTSRGQISGLSQYISLVSIAYDGVNFVGLCSNGGITTSSDGISWTTIAIDTNLSGKTWDILVSGANILVAINSDGYVSVKGLPTDIFATEAEWQQTYTTYGECGKYVYNAGAGTVRIPSVNSYFKNTVSTSDVGDLTPASIPNITGTFSGVGQAYHSPASPATLTGAFYRVNTTDAPAGGVAISNEGAKDDVFGIDASRNSNVYSDSATTVNTQSIKQLVYIVVAK